MFVEPGEAGLAALSAHIERYHSGRMFLAEDNRALYEDELRRLVDEYFNHGGGGGGKDTVKASNDDNALRVVKVEPKSEATCEEASDH